MAGEQQGDDLHIFRQIRGFTHLPKPLPHQICHPEHLDSRQRVTARNEPDRESHKCGCPTLATFLFLWLGWDEHSTQSSRSLGAKRRICVSCSSCRWNWLSG